MRILICEDDKNIAEVMETILINNGYSVDCEFNADKILEKIKKNKPQLIILDLCLAKTSGETISKKIRAEKKLDSIPLIFISASTQLERIAKDSMANDFLLKPFDIKDLLSLVRKYDPRRTKKAH